MTPPIMVAIGFDPREAIAWHVCAHSILRRASRPIRLMPIKLDMLSNWCYRRPYPLDEGASTEFAFTRFLTPYLAGGGTSIFMDCDMLVRADICELAEIAAAHVHDDVLVVKHDYTPTSTTKFLNQPQTTYPCKNWSSVMVFNGHRRACCNLTPAAINEASPMELHQFKWARSIGDLPPEWNHLVGEYAPNPDAKIVHFTLGGPWFRGFEHVEFADEWFAEYEHMVRCDTRQLPVAMPI